MLYIVIVSLIYKKSFLESLPSIWFFLYKAFQFSNCVEAALLLIVHKKYFVLFNIIPLKENTIFKKIPFV